MQTCRTCGQDKQLSEFDIRSDTGNHRTECKACRRERQRRPLDPTRRRTQWFVGNTEPLRCRKCGALKPWTEFPRRGRDSGRLQTWCKECFAAYKAERHKRNHDSEMKRIRRNQAVYVGANRARLSEYLRMHPCVDCGEVDTVVLEFDHVRGQKMYDVSRMVANGFGWEKIEEEIAKCEVRCANCHRRVTHSRRQVQRGIAEPVIR